MPKGLLFFCCACCILILTAINLSIGPVITKTVGGDNFSVQMTGFTDKIFTGVLPIVNFFQIDTMITKKIIPK